MNPLPEILTPEVFGMVKVFVIVVALIHLIAGVTLFRFIMNVSNQVKTPTGNIFRALGIVHIVLLIGILLAIAILF